MTEAEPIQVVIVDDHPIMRDGLRDALETHEQIEVVATVSSGEEAVKIARRLKPAVVVMDAIMPGLDGLDACRRIIDSVPQTRVLILTASTAEDMVLDAVASGARGFLQKVVGATELAQAVRDVAAGELRIPEGAVRTLYEEIRQNRAITTRQLLASLTPREREVLARFATGLTYAEIAEERENSSVTVRNTIYRIQDKLGLKTRQELIVWAVRSGLLEE